MQWAILIVVILICVFISWRALSHTESIRVGDRSYNVVGRYSNKKSAAEIFAKLHHKMMILMTHLKHKYVGVVDYSAINDAPRGVFGGNDLARITMSIIKNYNPDVFYENDPALSTETAYTVNKGTSMYFCVRSKETSQEFCDFNILLFAMLHEVSHIGTYDGWGHQVRFWEVFKFVLLEAVECGVYEPIDYADHPKDYCGLKVAYNPLFDHKLRDIRKVSQSLM